MNPARLLAAAVLAASLLPSLSLAQVDKAVVATERVRAELLAHAPQGVVPGQPVWVGLQIAHQPDDGDKAEQAPVETDQPLVPWIQLTPQQ